MIKWLKCAVNFSVSPPLQWPLPQVTNNCGVAVVLTGMTTEITPFPLWATLYLATHQIHLRWCLISTPRPLSIRVSGSRGPAAFICIWFWCWFLIILYFVLLSFPSLSTSSESVWSLGKVTPAVWSTSLWGYWRYLQMVHDEHTVL